MKSSSLHRAGLSRERMAMFENTALSSVVGLDKTERFEKYEKTEVPIAIKTQRNSELDLLYKGIEKGFSKVTSTSVQFSKTPGAYLGIGFIAGLVCMFVISLIVTLSSGTHEAPKAQKAPKAAVSKSAVSVIQAEQEAPVVSDEKYVIKKGDTLDKIAVRFYGKYDENKIRQIQTLNNIKNPASLQIGQVIIVPVNK